MVVSELISRLEQGYDFYLWINGEPPDKVQIANNHVYIRLFDISLPKMIDKVNFIKEQAELMEQMNLDAMLFIMGEVFDGFY